MENVIPNANQIPALLAAARLEKLNLEIEQLKKKRRWKKTLESYTPLISVLIAVGGGLVGIYQFQRQQQIQQDQIISEQQKDRLTREAEQASKIQNQIRSNINEILQFPSDEQQTTSKVSFLIEDLKSYLNLSSDKSPTSWGQNNMRRVTRVLVSSVVGDCDFDQPKAIQYARILAAQWEDYGRDLEEDTASLNFILSKYDSAAHTIYLKDPSMVRDFEYKPATNGLSFGDGKLNDAQIVHFQHILIGFSQHLKFLKDEESKKRELIRFQSNICNGKLIEQFFGVRYGAKDDKENLLGACPD